MKNLFARLTAFVKSFPFILITGIAIILTVNSCKPKEIKEKMIAIDSLRIVVHDCEKKLTENHMDTIFFFAKYLKNDTDIFQSELFTFPEDKELKTIFGNYTTLGKVFKRMNSTYLGLQKDIRYSKMQLDNLHHDIKNDLLTNLDTIQQYYNKEKEAVINIEVVTNSLVERLQSNMDYFNEINPKMNQFKEKVKDQFPGKEFSKLPEDK